MKSYRRYGDITVSGKFSNAMVAELLLLLRKCTIFCIWYRHGLSSATGRQVVLETAAETMQWFSRFLSACLRIAKTFRRNPKEFFLNAGTVHLSDGGAANC